MTKFKVGNQVNWCEPPDNEGLGGFESAKPSECVTIVSLEHCEREIRQKIKDLSAEETIEYKEPVYVDPYAGKAQWKQETNRHRRNWK